MKLGTQLGAIVVVAAALSAPVVVARAVPAFAQDAPVAPVTPSEWAPQQFGVQIPMRDGKSLAADVYLPAKPGRYPAIVIQTPYDRTRHRLALGGGQGGFGGGDVISGISDREHYAYVVVDWRGFYGSKSAGGLASGRVGGLGNDGFDVVEWAAAQTWSDTKVGTWGPSALGMVQFQTAAAAPPHLVCAVPLVAVYGHRYEDYYSDGVFREHHVASQDRLGFGTGGRVRDARDPAGALYRLARMTERPQSMDVPMLFISGWFDHSTKRTIETFQTVLSQGGPKAREGSRLLVGPWHHTAVDLAQQGDVQFPLAAGESSATALAFFDQHLRGIGTGGFAAGERVRFWRAGDETWVRVAAWPRPGTTSQTLVLHADGTISDAPAKSDEPVRSFLDDPSSPVPTVGGANLPIGGVVPGPRDQKAIIARGDVLVYTTEPLAEALRIEGASSVTVSVQTDVPDTDVAVRLCQVLDDGRSILLADSIARASFHAGRNMGSGDATDAPGRALLEPGEPRQVTVSLPPLAVTIPKYGRLRVIVAGTNWPRFERNGHTGGASFDATTAVAAKVEVLHDAAHPARIALTIAPPEPRPESAK